MLIFIIADVKNPILGADFLRHYSLLVDLKHNRLVDGITQLHIQGSSTQAPSPSPTLLPKEPKTDIDVILSVYPDIVQPCNTESPVKHNVTHHIKTVGPPVHARPRKLSPERLKAARQVFEHTLQQGIIRPSSSSGPHHYTWFLRNQVIGVHVEITEHSTTSQCQTATQSHIFKISPPPYKAVQSFLR